MMCAGSRARREDGAAAVEFALVVPMLLMLLFGTVTTGLSYSHAIGQTNAVREGSRFGATSATASMSTWVSDTISQTRSTQFDDPGPPFSTAVCVQLWKVTGAGTGTSLHEGCSPAGGSNPPTVGLPTTASATPEVPSTVPVGSCVVRVIAARKFEINLVVAPTLSTTAVRSAVARFERMDVFTTCK